MELKRKGAEDTLDYAFDWRPYTHGVPGAKTDWLATDEEITDFEITVEAGLTLETAGAYAASVSDGAVTIWLSGGTPGETYLVECKITTDAARICEKPMLIRIRELDLND